MNSMRQVENARQVGMLYVGLDSDCLSSRADLRGCKCVFFCCGEAFLRLCGSEPAGLEATCTAPACGHMYPCHCLVICLPSAK